MSITYKQYQKFAQMSFKIEATINEFLCDFIYEIYKKQLSNPDADWKLLEVRDLYNGEICINPVEEINATISVTWQSELIIVVIPIEYIVTRCPI